MLISVNFAYAQQALAKEVQPRKIETYLVQIQNLNSQTDEATIKEVRASLEDIFDVLPTFDASSGVFEFQTASTFTHEKVELLLADRGLVLISFTTKRNNVNYEVE